MGYALGVDLGTTYTSAAVARDGRVEIVPLGDRAPQVPSVVYLSPSGQLAFGEQAARHAVAEPNRVAREFKKRLVDQTNLLLGGEVSMSAPALLNALLRWVVDRVAAGQGGPPERVVVAHPASWAGQFPKQMAEVLALDAGIGTQLCAEPSAAAIHFALSGRMVDDRPVAVYDFGGGTFDAAVVHRASDGFEIVGTPEGSDQVGGLDLDDALFRLVLSSVEDVVDPNDPEALLALERLRKDCVEAKEALSDDVAVDVPVSLGKSRRSVRVTRQEFEDLISPQVGQTIETLGRTITRAGLSPADLGRVLLVGGSSRVPLVAELLARDIRRPLLATAQPKLCVAMGAALLGSGSGASAGGRAARRGGRGGDKPAPPVLEPTPEPRHAAPTPHAASVEVAPAPDAGVESETVIEVDPPAVLVTSETSSPSGSRRGSRSRPASGRGRLRWVGLALALVALVLAAFGPRERLPVEAAWDADHRVHLAQDFGPHSRLQTSVLGVPLPGRFPGGDDGTYDLTGQRIFLAGALRAQVLGVPRPTEVLLLPPPGAFWTRLLTLPGAALLVLALFGYAYAESLLRGIRRGRRAPAAGEVVGLVGTGAVIGVALVAASWIVDGRFLVLPAGVLTAVCCCAAVGLLGFGWDDRAPAAGSRHADDEARTR